MTDLETIGALFPKEFCLLDGRQMYAARSPIGADKAAEWHGGHLRVTILLAVFPGALYGASMIVSLRDGNKKVPKKDLVAVWNAIFADLKIDASETEKNVVAMRTERMRLAEMIRATDLATAFRLPMHVCRVANCGKPCDTVIVKDLQGVKHSMPTMYCVEHEKKLPDNYDPNTYA